MKIDYKFVEEIKDSLNLMMGLDEYGCFEDLDVQPDEDYIEDGVVYQYTVTFQYSTRNAADITISFNVCKVKEQPGYVESKYDNGDFAINTYEDNWHEVSVMSTEPLWLCLLDHVERYYQHELKKK